MVPGKPHGNFWFSDHENKKEKNVEIGPDVEKL